MRSEQLDKILPALHKAQGEFHHAKKDSANPHFKSSYADLATVLDTIKPALQANGLTVSHSREVDANLNEYLVTTLWHNSGQFLSSRSLLNPVKKDPQGYGSAITYARRYDLSALVGLASDDDDGNAASQGKKPTSKEVYGTATAMKKKYAEIVDAIEGALTHEQLKQVWIDNQAHIKAMQSFELGEEYHAQLVSLKDERKAKITEEEVHNAAYGVKQ